MNTITEADVRAVIGPVEHLDAEDIAGVVEQANADAHEGPEWMPYYKAATALDALALGTATGTLKWAERLFPEHDPRAVKLRRVLAEVEELFRASCRCTGLGPNHGDPERVAAVERLNDANFGTLTPVVAQRT